MTHANTPQPMARLEARVNPEVKALWQKAADLEGVTLTDFVIASVQAAACKVIEQHQTLQNFTAHRQLGQKATNNKDGGQFALASLFAVLLLYSYLA